MRISTLNDYELNQLIAFRVLSVRKYPMCDDQEDDSEAEEVIEIEMSEDEPTFLRGRTRHSTGVKCHL